jgi:zinc/manganese transport system ATP-binding protein
VSSPTNSTRAAQRVDDNPSVDDAVVFDDVSVRLGDRTIWSQGTFRVPRGSVVAVIGPNGAGKTTLLKVVLGVLAPASGRVEVFGAPPRRGNRRIGYVPQHYAAGAVDTLRSVDLVALGRTGTRWGLRRGAHADREAVHQALASVDALECGARRVADLSGGQQQRVAIARALVGAPELLLLDEPLASLDLRSQHEIVRVLGHVRDERTVTVFVVAHDLNPLLSIATSAVYLLDGHAHHGEIGEVVDADLLSHLYGTQVRVVRTAQGELFTRSG